MTKNTPLPDNNPRLTYRRSQDRLHGFISSLPGMACQIELQESGAVNFPYASEGCSKLIEVSPRDLLDDASRFLSLIHPDDAASFIDTLNQSARTLGFWSWEGRIVFPDDQLKWVSLGATPHIAQNGCPRWEGIMLDITQSKLGELEVRHAHQQMQELTSYIHDCIEQERLHIAREVHDEIGSLLTAIKLDLFWLTQRLPKDDQSLIDRAQIIEDLVNRSITSANNLAYSLRPGVLDHFGLIAAIEIEAQEFSKRSGVICTISTSHEKIELPSTHAITLFRILQETLNNILKHARAKNARIEIVKGSDHVELTVSDDGIGFGDDARNKPRSFGLRGIHERVAHLGGSVKIASAPHSGTQISIFVPLEAESNTPTGQPHLLFDGADKS